MTAPSKPPRPRTLTEALRAMSAEDLATLLAALPDLPTSPETLLSWRPVYDPFLDPRPSRLMAGCDCRRTYPRCRPPQLTT